MEQYKILRTLIAIASGEPEAQEENMVVTKQLKPQPTSGPRILRPIRAQKILRAPSEGLRCHAAAE
ncbi:MAG: hypothetical protein DHS20C08_20170 [Rhodomicrobium sp.]|nr:MAG: hypothetical protein DHS20C08_20170 [Rhodomicrobium sp.]